MQGGEKGTENEMGTTDGKGNGNATEDGKGKGKGKEKGNGQGKRILKQTTGGDDISHAVAEMHTADCSSETQVRRDTQVWCHANQG